MEAIGEDTIDDIGQVVILSDSDDHAWSEPLAHFLRSHRVDVSVFSSTEVLGRLAWDQIGGRVERFFRSRSTSHETSHAEKDRTGRGDGVVVVSASPSSIRSLDTIRTWMGKRLTVLAVVDDFSLPHRWRDVQPDMAVAPTEIQGQFLFPLDQQKPCYAVAGPPCMEVIDATRRTSVRETIGVSTGETVGLVDAAWMTESQVRAFIESLSQALPTTHAHRWLFAYGENGALAQVMRDTTRRVGLRAHMFGATTPITDVMAGIDVVICAPQSRTFLWALRQNIRVIPWGIAADHPLVQMGVVGSYVHTEDVVQAWRAYVDDVTAGRGATMTPLDDHVFDSASFFDAIWRLIGRAHRVRRASDGSSPPASADGFGFEVIGESIAPTTVTNSTPSVKNPKELRHEMAKLLLSQRGLETEHKELVTQRDLWIERIRDAEDTKEDELRDYAVKKADIAMRQLRSIQKDLEDIEQQKSWLRTTFASSTRTVSDGTVVNTDETPPAIEARFRRLDEQRQLRQLRARARDAKNDASGDP